MNTPLARFLLVLAIVFTGIALWAGPNLVAAVPAATIAIILAGLLLAEVAVRSRRPRSTEAPGPAPVASSEVRVALVSGSLGRERLVNLLDHLERSGPRATASPRRADEIREIVSLSPEAFRDYLRSRLDRLEADT